MFFLFFVLAKSRARGRGCQTDGYDDVGTVPVAGNDFQSLDRVRVPGDVVEHHRAILLDPGKLSTMPVGGFIFVFSHRFLYFVLTMVLLSRWLSACQ